MALTDESVRDAALSGGLSGTILGAGSSLIANGLNAKLALRRAAMGALAGGGLAGGGVAIGNQILGEPKKRETNPYTRRGTVGGAIAGAGAGTLMGAALANDYINLPKKLEPVGKYIRGRHPLIGALLGGLVGTGIGAYKIGDEGMQVDIIQREVEAARRRRRKEQL